MTALLLLPTILSMLLMAAHWLHAGNPLFALVSLLLPLLLLIRRRWVAILMQVLLVLACLEWALTTYAIAQARMEQGAPWLRAAIILLAVAAFNLLAAGLFFTTRLRARYGSRGEPKVQ